jgi:hypothetical protein
MFLAAKALIKRHADNRGICFQEYLFSSFNSALEDIGITAQAPTALLSGRSPAMMVVPPTTITTPAPIIVMVQIGIPSRTWSGSVLLEHRSRFVHDILRQHAQLLFVERQMGEIVRH